MYSCVRRVLTRDKILLATLSLEKGTRIVLLLALHRLHDLLDHGIGHLLRLGLASQVWRQWTALWSVIEKPAIKYLH